MNKKPNLLLINDDGIHAPGLKALWEALHPIANLWIVAPTIEQSGVGVSVTLRTPLTIHKANWEKGTPAWHVNGTPADCVRMALNVIGTEKPDLIVSGINKGSNAGRNVLYSGTVGGVIDGAFRKVPGVAFSCVDMKNPNYEVTKEPIQKIVEHLLKHPLPEGRVLNVNFPSNHAGKGIKLTRQGKAYIKENIAKGTHPHGHSYYWTGGILENQEEHEDSDIEWLEKGYITAVPLHINELTDLAFFNERKDHFEEMLSPLPSSK